MYSHLVFLNEVSCSSPGWSQTACVVEKNLYFLIFLHLIRDGIAGVGHHSWSIQCWGSNASLWVCQASALPNPLHHQFLISQVDMVLCHSIFAVQRQRALKKYSNRTMSGLRGSHDHARLPRTTLSSRTICQQWTSSLSVDSKGVGMCDY